MESAFHRPLKRLRLETWWLQEEFVSMCARPSERNKQLTCEMAVVRLHDAWSRFCRELIIISASERTLTLGGLQLKPLNAAINTRAAVVPFLLSTYKKRTYEPKWGDATECIDAARRLSIMNLATVAAALGAINSPANDIRNVRNFYAHRGKGAAQRAVATNLFSNPTRPVVFELSAYTSGGKRVIESWVERLLAVAIAAAQ